MNPMMDDRALDQALRAFLTGRADELAAVAIGEDEMTDRLRLGQQSRSRIGKQLPERRIALVAATVLVLALGGSVVILSSGLFDRFGGPTPTPETSRAFQTPFEYTLPAGGDLRLTDLDRIDSPVENLESLAVAFTDVRGHRGVVVAQPAGSTYPWCFGHQGLEPGVTAEQVLAVYDEWQGGSIGTPTAATLDSRPAASVRVDAGRCPTSHPWEREDIQPEPGVLTLVDVDGVLIVVSVWARTDAILDDWLPEADEFVQSIHFLGGQP